MRLRMFAKFQVKEKFCSRDMGSNGVKRGQKWSFWGFLENQPNNLFHFRLERRYYESSYVGKVSSPGKVLFLRYGVKWGQRGSKIEFLEISSKTSLTIQFIFVIKEDIMSLHMCFKFQVQENLCSTDMGSNVVRRGQKQSFL